jgi:hypothetical protein
MHFLERSNEGGNDWQEGNCKKEGKLLGGITRREEIADVNEMPEVRGWQKGEGEKRKIKECSKRGNFCV